jgi:hypothetical protein
MLRALAYLIAFVACLSIAASCGAEAPVALNSSSLTEVTTLAGLPDGIRNALGQDKSGLEGIAEKGARYNVTDVTDSHLPMRRFVVAGVSRDSAVVAVEHGGRARWYEAIRFSRKNSVWSKTERVPISREPRSLNDLLRQVAKPGE